MPGASTRSNETQPSGDLRLSTLDKQDASDGELDVRVLLGQEWLPGRQCRIEVATIGKARPTVSADDWCSWWAPKGDEE